MPTHEDTTPFFSLTSSDQGTLARTGVLSLGPVQVTTPVFMPVGTVGTVKGVWSSDLIEMGYKLILGNTYHLALRPGGDLIADMGGLKDFMSWPSAVLTDSGGYQVFSLAHRLRFFPEGVEFQSHIDGSRKLFTPHTVIELQAQFASDITMVLDDCPPANASPKRLEESLERTHHWAKQSLKHFQKIVQGKGIKNRYIFGIVQGGLKQETRQRSIEYIQALPFNGIALGGLSVGEERSQLYDMLAFLGTHLDRTRPCYLMGVGALLDILEAVKNGVDMFDCVLPTRNARNGQAFSSEGVLNLRNRVHRDSNIPLDDNCRCRVCQTYSRSYIRHLFMSGEMLGPMVLSFHNLFFYQYFMTELQLSIEKNDFLSFYKSWNIILKRSI